MNFELTHEYLDTLVSHIESQNDLAIRASLEELYSEDIVPVLWELDNEQRTYIIRLLDDETVGRIISHLDEATRTELFQLFSTHQLAKFINELYSDDAADVLNKLPVKQREEIIANIADEELARHISELLRYDEDCAGGIMAKEVIKANVNWTVKQTIEEIRRQAEDVEKIYTIYVVDDAEVLLGRVSLKKIILSKDRTPIAEIYESDIISVETYTDAADVIDIMRKYDLESVPVINVHGKLQGRITIDDALDVMQEQSVVDMHAMSGISSPVEEDDSVWKLSKARLPWLIIGMAGGMMGASFIGLFEQQLLLVPAMAFFIPLITATGGNVGVQSSSLVVQSLANSEGLVESQWLRIRRASIVALLNGLVIASLVLLCTWALGHPLKLSLVVSSALLFVVVLASVMGTVTPLVLERFGINPALASGPFITTANDLLGLAVYFGTAGLLYSI